MHAAAWTFGVNSTSSQMPGVFSIAATPSF
jgi:hypothetical protein